MALAEEGNSPKKIHQLDLFLSIRIFLIEFEVNGMKQIKPVAARKTIRLEYGSGPQILSV